MQLHLKLSRRFKIVRCNTLRPLRILLLIIYTILTLLITQPKDYTKPIAFTQLYSILYGSTGAC